jgi:outer membrane protein OmpA-like peptidoglycan-associated protein
MATSGWLPSIFFDLNSAEVNPKYNETLATIALILKNNPDITLNIIGNCDFRSSADYNIKLGKRRAEAVKKHLIRKYKVDSKRLQIESLGKNDPITNQDHRMNRRVDFQVAE